MPEVRLRFPQALLERWQGMEIYLQPLQLYFYSLTDSPFTRTLYECF